MTHPLEAGLRSWLERAAHIASVDPRRCTSFRLAAVSTAAGEVSFVLELSHINGSTRRLELTHDDAPPLHSVRAACSALRLVDDQAAPLIREPGQPSAQTIARTR